MPSTASPLVSVIVCARNRPDGLERALASIWSQNVPDLELLLVSDGDAEPVAATAPSGQFRRIPAPVGGVGAARAAGLEAARGNFVAYCDDDDTWTPGHLPVLLAALAARPDAVLAAGQAVWTDGGEDDVDPALAAALGDAAYIAATCAVHRTAAARAAGGFDAFLAAHEDRDLWARMAAVDALCRLPVVVAVRARSPDRIAAVDHPADRERVLRCHARDHPAFAEEPAPPFDPATWRPGRRELAWASPLHPRRSFGLVAQQLLPAVARTGVDIVLANPAGAHLPAEFARYARPPDGRGRVGFRYEYLNQPTALASERLALYTMRESTHVPPGLVAAIDRSATLLYVPCRQNVVSFRANGVRAPIRVLHHGVDPDRFPVLDRDRDRTRGAPFVFGTVGDLSVRKGIDVLVRAFREEFAAEEPVRLLLKDLADSPVLPVSTADDPRITVVRGYLGQPALLALLRSLDAFVLPSRGEGFGLTGLEAMATGLPLIATDWGGPAEYLDPDDTLPLAYRLVPARGAEAHGVRFFGDWAEPDAAHLRTLMRWVFTHRAEAAAMGARAAARARRDWGWERVALRLRADLDALAAGISPA